MNRFSISLCFFLIGSATAAWAQDSDPLRTAQGLYESGKFAEALTTLQSATQLPKDGHFYYNLGTLYFRLGQTGPSVAYLEKANRLKPHDSEVQHNLNLAKQELSKQVGADQLDPASTTLEALADNIPLEEIRGTLGLVSLILALIWTRSYLKSRNLKKTLTDPAGVLGVLALLITGFLYVAQRISHEHPPAALVESQVIRSGPGEQFIELSRAQAGTKLRVLGPTAPNETNSQEIWHQVRYSGDGIGWVRASSLLLL